MGGSAPSLHDLPCGNAPKRQPLVRGDQWAGDAVSSSGLLLTAALAYAPSRDLRGSAMSALLILPLYARRSRPRSVLVMVTLPCLL